MWIISFLPDFVFHLITIAGVLGLVAAMVLTFIPFVDTYKLPIQVASVLALVFGIYFEGAISNEASWQARVKELEVKVAQAEAKAAEENTKLVEKLASKDKIIKQRGDDIIKYVEREIVKYDSQCVIPKEFIKAINDAAGQTK